MFKYLVALCLFVNSVYSREINMYKCPEVRAMPNFEVAPMLGAWNIVEYYASSEEALSYSCIKANFMESDHVKKADGTVKWELGVTMNFTYRFIDDPEVETLVGNITWTVDHANPAHWTHSEDSFADIYNTFVMDTDYKTWMLLLHCAEPTDGPRYLSAYILSRTNGLAKNEMAYLRDKLPRYQVDIKYVFPVSQEKCEKPKERKQHDDVVINYYGKQDKAENKYKFH